MRRTKATLIYRRTGNVRVVQLLLGHTRIDYVPRRTTSCWTAISRRTACCLHAARGISHGPCRALPPARRAHRPRFFSEKARQISSPRLRPKLHSIPPLSLPMPATWRPRRQSSTGVHGTRAKPRPLSFIANRPEVNVRRWR
jgi:hypothetical protein